MKIQYLGTAAAEAVPAPFCNCRVCKLSREKGGRNMRSRSQTLINDELLIDFNADTVWHFHRYGFDWEKICACLITHSHSDHLYPADVEFARRPFTHEHRTVHFYAGESGYRLLNVWTAQPDSGASATLIEGGKRFEVAGKRVYSVLPLPANHSAGTSPLIFVIECESKRILYAHDTGRFPEETRQALYRAGTFDFISFDCTGCLSPDRDWTENHMSVGSVLKELEQMKNAGVVSNHTVTVLNHFSHNGGLTYDELAEAVKELGLTVSYDGMTVEI